MKFEILAEGLGFTEGPVVRDTGEVVVVSIDTGNLHAVGRGRCELFAVSGGNPNGLAIDGNGDLYIAQAPRKPRGMVSGGVQVVSPGRPAEQGAGPYPVLPPVEFVTLDLVSPNDLCFGPSGDLWVTDPTRRPQRDDSRIWRVDVRERAAELVSSVPYYANGLAFGPEGNTLYVVSTGDGRIVRYEGAEDRLGAGEVFAQVESGHPDGCAFDVDGNLIVAVNGQGTEPGYLQVFDRSGSAVERVEPRAGRWFTNVAVGSDSRLIVTHPDVGGVLEARWPVPGLPLYPMRK